jgi:uncharacterized repeat protein (TIGR02543 family)
MKQLSNPLLRLCWLWITLALFATDALAAVNRPFPQHVTYAAGSIRPTNFTQTEQDQHVRDFYDYWKSNYLVAAGTSSAGKSMYRIAFGKGSDTTVSEGQGYGMVTVALMAGYDANAQTLFNSLWYFSRQYPSAINKNLMSWKVQNGAIVGGNNNAFDGDIDIAYGLLLAHEQWGSSGEVNYQAEAKLVIDAILTSTIGQTSFLPKLGDWTSDNGSKYNQYTPRSSDFMPAHFRAFAKATQNSAWTKVITNTQAVIDTLQKNYSSSTGLLPDFIVDCQVLTACRPAYGGFLEGSHDGEYYYNAGRNPWRIGLDALLNADSASKTEVVKIIKWLAGSTFGVAGNIKAGYTLNGTPIGHYSTSFFVAPFGVGAMLDSTQQSFLNDIYKLVYNKRENYYEDSVNILNLLVLTGNYWQPDGGVLPAAACADKVDNDGDGKIDYPNDPGCSSATDNDETDSTGNKDVVVTVKNTNDWGTGYCADVFVNNPTSNAIDWLITFTIDGTINQLWNAIYKQTGQQVTAEGVSWNNLVQPNQTVSFGFCALRNSTPQNYTLTVNKSGTGSGTVSSSPTGISCGADCSESYKKDTAVTLTAKPVAGSKFTGWSGACAGTTTTCTVSMSDVKNVGANFDLITYKLTVSKSGAGTITSSPIGISCGTDCSEFYVKGKAVVLTAKPATGYRFTGWTGACTGTATTCSLTMNTAQTTKAVFVKP